MKDRNENRSGYKKTKVGWIPDQWVARKIMHTAEVRYGLTVNKKRRSGVRRRPYLTVANFSRDGFRLGCVKEIGCTDKDEQMFKLQAGDILVVEGNGSRDIVGAALIWNGEVPNALHQNHLLRLRIKSEEMDPKLLVMLINSGEFRRRLEPKIITSSGLNTINSTVLGNMIVTIPPKKEHERIISIMTEWDAAIEKSHDLIAAKKLRKKGLMQQLLTGNRRLPGFKGHTHENKHIGTVAANWSLQPLSHIFAKITRKNTCGVTRVLTASGDSGLVDQRKFFTKTIASEDVSGYYLLERGEYAYNRSAMNGYPYGAIKRLDSHDQGVLSTLYTCFAIRQGRGVADFYTQFFEAGLLNRQLRRITQVGGRAHGLLNITDTDFFSVCIPVPELPEQRAIAAVLMAADAEIAAEEQRLEALKEQKRGLMQKLLTGEVRVKV